MIDPKNIAVDAFKEECPECFSDLYFRNVLVPGAVAEVMIVWCVKCDRKEKQNKIEHSQREHDINVYNFGACDDDAHDPNNWRV